eukprot:TRINITY_DN582_c0_g2_i9.p1 TRINITY_DN582_c0_g2~~TRINITY_DN582_c0_g2_i9.p1  ORF type:complete len:508 (+),score=109.11 TRINITY_DN582_c0_g2_i9:192-1715(+)
MNRIFVILVVILSLGSTCLARSLICNACISGIETYKSYLRSGSVVEAEKRKYYERCIKSGSSRLFCAGRRDNVVPYEYKAQISKYNSDEMCWSYGLCTDVKYVKDPHKSYAAKVLAHSPPYTTYEGLAPNRSKPIKFLVVTDIHMDFDYREGKKVTCGESICCRTTSGNGGPGDEHSGLYGHIGKCDLPVITTQSFIDHATKFTDLSFVLYLGDNPAHDMWEQKPEVHLKGLKKFTEMLKVLKVPVYSVLGNHEGYPCDQFDATGANQHQWVIEGALDAWRDWFTPQMKETFRRNGCYSVVVPGTTLKLIALTPFTMMSSNRYLWGNQTDPLGVLKWFEEELHDGEEKGQSVIIFSHLPPNHPPFNPYWSERYLVLVERYTNIIRGLLYGHVHQDYFTILRGRNHQPINIAYTCPSLTTYTYNNPAYRVFEIDGNTYKFLDYVQYSMNIEQSNRERRPLWKQSYRFTEYYNVPSLSVRSHLLLRNEISVSCWRKCRTMRQYVRRLSS